ncbi:MAG: hypothetical protein BGP24_20080 [Lysobacterales bacterium 69-70]|nr:hypothetical protein [Xanthomonadaceae bacterium]ODU35784.1 MAG: hypothetical protein ABS97_02870 [Xanthomonadaceae bacterium SCN 69-320]ODV17478.1 MAG: hypothetical protein ABT27_17205 [Xanthomonadaceae bacterium SCN 69-25]OJY97272.1 MAG: hypothetical protein BGP24_20080 [Xanthomonadales bacterium 69-70]
MDDLHDSLIRTLYGELAQSTDWAQEFLAGLCRATGSHAGAVVLSDLRARRDSMPAFFGAQDASAVAYERHYAEHNPWRRAHASAPRPAGSVLVSDDLVPYRDLRESLFHRDFLRHLGLDHGVGLVGVSSPTHLGSLTLLRTHRRGAFGADEVRFLTRIAEHWSNACRLRARLEGLDGEPPFAAAFDRLATAVLLLGEDGAVLRVNAAADALLRSGDVLLLRGKQVAARHGAARFTLARAIDAVLARSCAAVELVPLHDAAGILVAQAAVHRLAASPHRAACAALFVQYVGGMPGTGAAEEALRKTYGLTVKEALFAVRLADLRHLGDTAAEFGWTVGGARQRLKTILGKTGTARQADLFALMRAMAAALGQ